MTYGEEQDNFHASKIYHAWQFVIQVYIKFLSNWLGRITYNLFFSRKRGEKILKWSYHISFHHRSKGNNNWWDLLLVNWSFGKTNRYLQWSWLSNAMYWLLEGKSQVLPYHVRPTWRIYKISLLGRLHNYENIYFEFWQYHNTSLYLFDLFNYYFAHN